MRAEVVDGEVLALLQKHRDIGSQRVVAEDVQCKRAVRLAVV